MAVARQQGRAAYIYVCTRRKPSISQLPCNTLVRTVTTSQMHRCMAVRWDQMLRFQMHAPEGMVIEGKGIDTGCAEAGEYQRGGDGPGPPWLGSTSRTHTAKGCFELHSPELLPASQKGSYVRTSYMHTYIQISYIHKYLHTRLCTTEPGYALNYATPRFTA